MKPINVDPKDIGLHDTNSSELSASTTSNSTLPQLEATDAEKAQNEEERRRRRRRAARKEKREAREKKKKEEQWLEEKKARKEDSREKLEEKEEKKERRRNKKQKPPMHLQVSYLATPKMVMMMSPTK